MRIIDVMAGAMMKTALSPTDVRRYVRNARNPDYWRKLNPQLSISDKLDLGKVNARPITASARRLALQKLESDGYFHLESIYPDRFLGRIREGIENLVKANWPTVFIYVYDECWAMRRIPSFVGLLDGILGPGHLELQNSWAHYVRPVPGAHGWAPHLDGWTLSGRVSAWFPITDATLDNGCIYIIPQNRIPESLTGNFSNRRTFKLPEVQMLMQAARALPVKAGSILGWNFKVVHLGFGRRTNEPSADQCSNGVCCRERAGHRA